MLFLHFATELVELYHLIVIAHFYAQWFKNGGAKIERPLGRFQSSLFAFLRFSLRDFHAVASHETISVPEDAPQNSLSEMGNCFR